MIDWSLYANDLAAQVADAHDLDGNQQADLASELGAAIDDYLAGLDVAQQQEGER
jgi:type IV pilus biogenesis protein CpaD/CtpE